MPVCGGDWSLGTFNMPISSSYRIMLQLIVREYPGLARGNSSMRSLRWWSPGLLLVYWNTVIRKIDHLRR